MGFADHWQVALRAHGASVVREMLPEETLQCRDEPDGLVWESTGDHAGFRLGEGADDACLPAGWYELDGCIECLEGVVTLPSLRIVYAQDDVDAEEIALADVSPSGDLKSLVLFKYPVSKLRFCPGVWAARFRMRGFGLRRVSRGKALWVMLRGKPRVMLQRASKFFAKWRTTGLRPATDAAFADYSKRQRPPGMTDYDVWVRKYDTFTPSRLAALQRLAAAHAGADRLSVLLVASGDDARILRRRVNDVRQQLWSGWQLCVVGHAPSDSAALSDALAHCATDDGRIHVAPALEKDAVAAFNRALSMATGSHVVVLGADARLRRHALLEMVALRDHYPGLAFAYADEDWLEAEGPRRKPYFKPEWNPDLLRSQAYIGPFAMIRTELVRAVGGLQQGYGDSVLHDLFLRCTENLQRSEVRHVPQILYHRCDATPTAETDVDGIRAVTGHLARLGVCSEVEACADGVFHVRWPLPSRLPKISLVIPTRDRVDLLRTCVESVQTRTSWPDFEIVVIDNQSEQQETLDYLDELRGQNDVRVLRDDAPFNYAAINNRAVARCEGELVCLVNNDIEVISPDWLEEMAAHALRPEIGAVGAMLYYPDDTIQHAGVIMGLHGVADHIYAGRPRGWPGHGGRARVAQELSAVTAACLLVRRSTYLEVGGLDERLAVAFNDVDFCLRLRERGLHNLWTPHAELYHHESASRGSDDSPQRKVRYAGEIAFMRSRWPAMLRADPAYNPNLSLRASDGELAFPPRAS